MAINPYIRGFFVCGIMGRFGDIDPLSMEKAMLKNMFERTGKNIEDWFFIINSNIDMYTE